MWSQLRSRSRKTPLLPEAVSTNNQDAALSLRRPNAKSKAKPTGEILTGADERTRMTFQKHANVFDRSTQPPPILAGGDIDHIGQK